jgi:hypothetical protein
MDGHHHMPPHGHDSASYQNGYNAVDEFGNILSNGGENDNFGNWGFDAASHIPNQNAQSDPYLSWQSNTGLDNYNPQAFTKSPSTLQAASYTGYGNPHQYSHSSYDPSLVSGATNGPSSYELDPSPYGQPQQMQHGTIAPQALEHERAHAVRPSQTLDPQSYSRSSTTDPAAYTRAAPAAPTADQAALHNAIPTGTRTGNFWMKDADRLGEATNSTPFNSFTFVGKNEFELPINRGQHLYNFHLDLKAKLTMNSHRRTCGTQKVKSRASPACWKRS